MIKYLNKTRKPLKSSPQKQIISTALMLLFGFGMGMLAKFIDCTPSKSFPAFLLWIDIKNIFDCISVWMFIALAVAVFSKSPLKAAINVFSFFAGTLFGNYLYTRIFVGIYPDNSYLIMWLAFTAVSPFLAFICWYARGRGALAIGISSVLIAVFAVLAFSLRLDNFYIAYIPSLVLWLASIGILYRNPRQSVLSFLISVPVAFALEYTGLLGFIGIY